MRWTIGIVSLVVAAGLATAAWVLGTAESSPSAVPTSGQAASAPGPDAGAVPVDGSEVLPPADETADRLPPLSEVAPAEPASPRITAPLPENGFARGELVAGFPVDLAGPAPNADVIDSSLAGDGTALQVTLTARTDASADDVRAHYAARWADLGLTPAAGAHDTSYMDAFSSVTLAFTSGSGTGTVYTVYAVLRTE